MVLKMSLCNIKKNIRKKIAQYKKMPAAKAASLGKLASV